MSSTQVKYLNMGRSEFAKYSKKLRIRSGLTQKDVAKSLKLQSGQLVSNWERGSCYPPARFLKKISDLYNVELEELFNKYAEDYKDDLWKKVYKKA